MHVRHLRQRTLERLRHSTHFLSWLTTQAARLGSTVAAIFAQLKSGSTSDEIEALAPIVNTAVPVITGTAQVGQNLVTDNGTWSQTGLSYGYQWKSGGANVGTSQNTYTPVAGDVGKTITVTVTATKGVASTSATSAATAAVIA